MAASDIGYAADDQPAVIAPGQRHPLGILGALVAEICGGLERLIVVDAEYAARQWPPCGMRPPSSGGKYREARMAEGPVGLETLSDWLCSRGPVTPSSSSYCQAIRERDRRIQQRAES